MISEIPAQKVPKLKMPEYVIDNKLGVKTPPWPAYHSFVMFVGKSKSGKSSLLTALLEEIQEHNNMYPNA